jgi:hypothetical protein
MVAIKGHFDGSVFVPDEPVDLPRGQAVVMHVVPTPVADAAAVSPNGDGDFWTVLQKLSGSVEAPADWSAEHDHYLYGTPKKSAKGAE